MHDQTRSPLLGPDVPTLIRAARDRVKGWPPLRRALVAMIILWLIGTALWKLPYGTGLQDQEPAESSAVLVADEYIPAFRRVKKSMVTLKNFPGPIVPPGSFHALTDLTDENGQPFYASAVALPAGHPLTASVLSDLRKTNSLSASLPAGHVAVSIAVDKVRGAGGWVQPGDHVAIFLTSRSLEKGLRSLATSRLLFPAASVIAIDKDRLGTPRHPVDGHNGLLDAGDAPDAAGSILTLSMNFVEAATLIQAEQQGHLTVALRAWGDDLEVPPQKTDARDPTSEVRRYGK